MKKFISRFIIVLVTLFAAIGINTNFANAMLNNSINSISKNSPLYLQHASSVIADHSIANSHYSHASHASHASHESHRSHYSSRY